MIITTLDQWEFRRSMNMANTNKSVIGIGSKMNTNEQLQEFTEVALSKMFDRVIEDNDVLEDIADDMGITTDEVMWCFKELGYTEEEEIIE